MSRSRAPLHKLNLHIRIMCVPQWFRDLVVVVDWELVCMGWLLWWV